MRNCSIDSTLVTCRYQAYDITAMRSLFSHRMTSHVQLLKPAGCSVVSAMDYYTILAVPILIAILWHFTANLSRTSHPHFTNKSILLLIAHPDDEAMFFSPTLLALTAPNSGNHVKILCLSNGNADGLGKTREKELKASGETLGLRSRDDILVLGSPDFVDGMKTVWEVEKIAEVLSQAFSPPQQKGKEQKTTDRPKATIDVLITFDHFGVSSHPNHIALYHGARHWLNELIKGKPGWRYPVELHTLTSISITRKYVSRLPSARCRRSRGCWRASCNCGRRGPCHWRWNILLRSSLRFRLRSGRQL